MFLIKWDKLYLLINVEISLTAITCLILWLINFWRLYKFLRKWWKIKIILEVKKQKLNYWFQAFAKCYWIKMANCFLTLLQWIHMDPTGTCTVKIKKRKIMTLNLMFKKNYGFHSWTWDFHNCLTSDRDVVTIALANSEDIWPI